jgi:hypothetical protein
MVSAKSVWFQDKKIFIELNDGRVVGSPIDWYPNLKKGTLEQMKNYELWEDGKWIHWEDLNEDLSAEGFLNFVK